MRAEDRSLNNDICDDSDGRSPQADSETTYAIAPSYKRMRDTARSDHVEEVEEDDHRDGNAECPEQDRAHIFLLALFNWLVNVWRVD